MSNPRVPITTAAGRWDGQPDLIGSAHSVNCLQQQIEVESTFHLDDGELLRLAVLDRDLGGGAADVAPVSYTHQTLPTTSRV